MTIYLNKQKNIPKIRYTLGAPYRTRNDDALHRGALLLIVANP